MTRLTRVEGSTFIEIAEARALPDGRLLYCTAVRGLQVVDATDPTAIKTIAALKASLGNARFGGCQHLAVDGERAYMTNRGNGTQKTPFVVAAALHGDQPREIAAYASKGRSFEGIAARGNRVYVAMHEAGIAVLDVVGNRFVERSVVKGSLASAWDVELVGDRLFVTDARGALAIFDAATTPPALLGRTETEGTAQAITVVGTTAFVAAGAAGLVVVDVSDPTAPRVADTFDTPGSAVEIASTERHVFLADWESVRVYDISKPLAPQLVATETIVTKEPFSRVLGVAARGLTAFIGEWTGMYAYRLHPERKAPAIVVSRAAIDFRGQAGSEQIAIENHGRAPLTVDTVRTEGPAFSTATEGMTVPPNELRFIDIAYAPNATESTKGTLILETNDPDDPSVRIPLVAGGEGLTVGATAPEIELELVDGGTWRLSDHRGKTVLLAYFATF